MGYYALPRHEIIVLVWCRSCERYISRETGHACTLPPAYRSRRAAERAMKNQEMNTHARH